MSSPTPPSPSSPNPDQHSITIAVNGDPKTCLAQLPLPELLEQLGVNTRLVAVEYNGEILQRPVWPKTRMEEGDRLEIVTIVGGG
jgi:sulfur carrier protein